MTSQKEALEGGHDMWIWNCKAMDMDSDKEVTKTFDDSNILLDCIIESEAEGMHYCLDRCLGWCRENHYIFVSFELEAN